MAQPVRRVLREPTCCLRRRTPGRVGAAEAHTTGIHDNCTNFNKRYPNGVGTRKAVDKGGDSTHFLRNNRIYWRAENHNGDLDRDNDRIACEGS